MLELPSLPLFPLLKDTSDSRHLATDREGFQAGQPCDVLMPRRQSQ